MREVLLCGIATKYPWLAVLGSDIQHPRLPNSRRSKREVEYKKANVVAVSELKIHVVVASAYAVRASFRLHSPCPNVANLG